MSVLEALAREHELFERLLHRLDRALDAPDPDTGRSRVEGVLLVLFPAMDRHEEIESLVFGSQEYASRPGARELLKECELQHDALNAVRKDMRLVLSHPETYTWEHMRSLGALFIASLRGHFRVEEQKLWPHYQRTLVRSAARATERAARLKVGELERELEKRGRLLVEFLDKPAD